MFVCCRRLFLFKGSTLTSENNLWNVSLTLLCYLWLGKYFMGFLVSGLACPCVLSYVLQSSSYCIQDLTTVYIFFFSLWMLSIVRFGTVLVFANLQVFKVIVQRQDPSAVSKLCFAKVSNSGDKWIQVRSRKLDFQGVLRQNLNRTKFRSFV